LVYRFPNSLVQTLCEQEKLVPADEDHISSGVELRRL
jgi:hypothetical protein